MEKVKALPASCLYVTLSLPSQAQATELRTLIFVHSIASFTSLVIGD